MRTAKLSRRTLALCAAASLALALGVLLLHAASMLLPAGEADAAQYVRMRAEDAGNVLVIDPPETKYGMTRISGALLRPGKRIGAVRLDVALMGEKTVRLRTKMFRAFDLARAYGSDDHTGFAAAALSKLLPEGESRIVLLDETEGEKRLIETGWSVRVSPEGVSLWQEGEARDGD